MPRSRKTAETRLANFRCLSVGSLSAVISERAVWMSSGFIREGRCGGRHLLAAIAQERIDFLSDCFIHFDQRRPGAFVAFAGKLFRGVDAELGPDGDFRS